MAQYNNAILTQKGIELLNKVMAGDGEMEFSFLATGSGTYSEEDKKPETIRGMTALKEIKQELPFSSVEAQAGDFVVLTANIINTDLDQGYQIYEMGVYAGIKGSTDRVLYCVITAEEPEFIPDSQSEQAYEIIYRILVKVHDAENVYITFSSGTYVLAEEFDENVRKTEEKLNLLQGQMDACEQITDLEIDAIWQLSGGGGSGGDIRGLLPIGGTQGQYLKKTSDEDYDVGWEEGGSGVVDDITTGEIDDLFREEGRA